KRGRAIVDFSAKVAGQEGNRPKKGRSVAAWPAPQKKPPGGPRKSNQVTFLARPRGCFICSVAPPPATQGRGWERPASRQRGWVFRGGPAASFFVPPQLVTPLPLLNSLPLKSILMKWH